MDTEWSTWFIPYWLILLGLTQPVPPSAAAQVAVFRIMMPDVTLQSVKH